MSKGFSLHILLLVSAFALVTASQQGIINCLQSNLHSHLQVHKSDTPLHAVESADYSTSCIATALCR